MSERITHTYKRLFEIRVLHHYWLDDGATPFDRITPQSKRDRFLLAYDMRDFLTIRPTGGTAEALKGSGCIYRNTALGCVVAARGGMVVAGGGAFDFLLTVRHPDVFQYTALTLRPRKVHTLNHPVDNRTYRYKENVPVLSNRSGAARVMAGIKTLFLSKEVPPRRPDDPVESLVQADGALSQLTSDEPGAEIQEIGAAVGEQPVYVHQGDVPAMVPPPGLTGAPTRGVELSDEITGDVFALVRLFPVREDDGDFSFLDDGGEPKRPAPVFHVRFKNRSTLWQYRDNSNGTVDSTEARPLPLTYFGNAGSREKPSSGLVKTVTSGGRITQLLSEVFIQRSQP